MVTSFFFFKMNKKTTASTTRMPVSLQTVLRQIMRHAWRNRLSYFFKWKVVGQKKLRQLLAKQAKKLWRQHWNTNQASQTFGSFLHTNKMTCAGFNARIYASRRCNAKSPLVLHAKNKTTASIRWLLFCLKETQTTKTKNAKIRHITSIPMEDVICQIHHYNT